MFLISVFVLDKSLFNVTSVASPHACIARNAEQAAAIKKSIKLFFVRVRGQKCQR